MSEPLVIDATQVARFAAEVAVLGPKVAAGAVEVTRHFGELVNTRIQQRASSAVHGIGEPHIGDYSGEGPNVASGDYRRSWKVTYGYDAFGFYAQAATNKPQAFRLEYGFVGEDRLKRHYDQPPLPHAQPAFDQTAPEFLAGLAAMVRAVTP